MKRGRFSEQERELVKNMHNAGVSDEEIAQSLNRSVETVRKVVEFLNAQEVTS